MTNGEQQYDPELMEMYKTNKVMGDLAKKTVNIFSFAVIIFNQQSEWDFTNKPREPQ